MPKFNLGWLKDKNGEKFAPKTFLSQILNNDGSSFKDKVESIENKLAEHDNKIVNNEGIAVLESRVNTLTEFANGLSDTIIRLSSTITTNTENIADLTERVTNHEKRYTQTQFVLTDEAVNCDYVVKIYNGEIVYFKKCVGIKITSKPTNLNVIEGGLLDKNDIVVVAVCQDGSEREITDYKMTPVDLNQTQITITYEELGETYSASVEVNVTPIQDALIDFTYTSNNDGTYTITDWKGTYNGEPSTRVIVPKSNKVII